MTKKTALIIIVTIIILVVGGLLTFYFYANRGQGNSIVPENPAGGNIFPNTSTPGGNANQTPSQTATTTPRTGIASGQGTTQPIPVLKELSMRPSAGAIALATSSQIFVRFVEKGTGNVYEVSPENSTETRLSNTTIPKIQEVIWQGDATHLIARYTKDGEGDTIQSYYAALGTPAPGETDGSLQGSYLSDNIASIATNPDQNKIFYIIGNSGGSTGIMSNWNGTGKVQIFASPLKEWLPEWQTVNTVSLLTKPSANVSGFLFFLNTKNGALRRAMSGIPGLSAIVSPDSNLALYSQSGPSGLSLNLYSFKTGTSESVAVATLPEKCIWSKNDLTTIYCAVPKYLPTGAYPDDWYQGAVSFSDDIWKIDAATGVARLTARLKDSSGKEIDAINLFMDKKENYLFFTNKNDFHMWSLNLQQ